jgi:hypothetical protein
MKGLKPHRFAELLPLMTEAEYHALKSDIAANRQRDDIELYEGKILDGRNRHRACIELGVKPRTRHFKGSESDALAFVYSKAVHRNMTDSQKAASAVKMLPHFEKLAHSNGKVAKVELVPPLPSTANRATWQAACSVLVAATFLMLD